MELKRAIHKVLTKYMPEVEKHFNDCEEMARRHSIDMEEVDHIFFAFLEIEKALEEGKFDSILDIDEDVSAEVQMLKENK